MIGYNIIIGLQAYLQTMNLLSVAPGLVPQTKNFNFECNRINIY